MRRASAVDAVMVSCVQRREERARTLASLAKQGVHPRVFENPCNPAGREANRRTGVKALRTTRSGVLFCEDDIRASDTLPAFLRLAIEADLTTTFCSLRDACLNDQTRSEIKAEKPMRPRLEAGRSDNWYGIQCTYIPQRVVDLMLAHPKREKPTRGEKWDGTDFLLKDVLVESGEPLLFALPNPVQHTAPPSVVAGKRQQKKSTTFHLGVDRPMSEATVDA